MHQNLAVILRQFNNGKNVVIMEPLLKREVGDCG